MPDGWIADVVVRMHEARITSRMLAKESGYSYEYISEILHGKRGSDKREKTRQNIVAALSRLEESGVVADGRIRQQCEVTGHAG